MSVREAESLVKKLGAEFNLVPQKPKSEKSRDLKRIEEELSDLLTAQVEVRVKKRVKRMAASRKWASCPYSSARSMSSTASSTNSAVEATPSATP
jgi:hypothetical protein